MHKDAHRTRASAHHTGSTCGRERRRATRCAGLLGGAVLAVFAGSAGHPAKAQDETVIIGGSGVSRGPVQTAPSNAPVIGGGGSGIVVNDAVLDTLGPGPAAAMPVPGSAGTAEAGAPAGPDASFNAPVVAPGAPGTAYRLPGTGQLVVSRPSTLLFPPLEFPESRLTAEPPPGAASDRSAPAPKPQITEREKPAPRLLVPAPEPEVAPAPKVEPVEEQAAPAPAELPKTEAPRTAAEAETPAPEPAESTEKMAAAPAAPAAPEPEEPTREEPAQAEEPTPPSMTSTAKTEETQAATRTSATAGLDRIQVLFAQDSADLSDEAQLRLETLAAALQSDISARIELLAYAQANSGGTSKARRLSLSRALAVRAYLIDNGVRATRMDVRALGDKVQDGPPDRVDIVPQ